jgi:murein tripeptide amidase MpaA
MRLSSLLTISTIFLAGLSWSQTPIETYFRLPLQSQSEMQKISKTVSIAKVEDNWIYAYANAKGMEKFQKYNFYYEVLPHPNEHFSAIMAQSLEQLREWDSYPEYGQYVDMVYQFADDYPDLCIIENIGYSVNGRELLFVKLSDNASVEEDEPEFMYSAQMHGNETVGFIMMLHLIDHFLTNYGVDTDITFLLNEVEIWINPLANPDGAYYGGDQTINGAIRSNANGVDLNRNFPDFVDGLHPDGNDWQPENIAMMDFISDHNFVISSNIHSGAELVNYPWDTASVLTADDDWWQMVSHTYADTAQFYSPNGYFDGFDDGISNGYAWYEADGTRQDYVTYFQHGREMTLELTDQYLLPENQLLDHWDYNHASFINYIKECLYGIRGHVTNEFGEPLEAIIRIPDHDMDNSEVHTDPDHGNYHRLIMPGTYDLQFEAWGYISEEVAAVNVSPNHATIVDVSLEPSPQYSYSGGIYDSETGEAIEGAIIEFLDVPIEVTYSNEDGFFELDNVFVGTYNLHIFAEGYSAYLAEVFIDENIDSLVFNLETTSLLGFESGNIPLGWSLAGDAPWGTDSDISWEGLFSVKSGDIGDDQISALLYTMEVPIADEISFYCKVACEDDNNDNYDYLYFAIDGVEQERWDGQVDWHLETYPVDAGLHTFSWVYSKDGSVSHYSDAGWIDAISLPYVPDVTDIVPGDVNFDLSVDVLDIVLVVSMILNNLEPSYEQFIAADLDEDDIITVLDIVILINIITE